MLSKIISTTNSNMWKDLLVQVFKNRYIEQKTIIPGRKNYSFIGIVLKTNILYINRFFNLQGIETVSKICFTFQLNFSYNISIFLAVIFLDFHKKSVIIHQPTSVNDSFHTLTSINTGCLVFSSHSTLSKMEKLGHRNTLLVYISAKKCPDNFVLPQY